MWKQQKQWETLFWGAPKSPQIVSAAMKLKDACSLEEKYDQPSSVQFSRSVMSDSETPWTKTCQASLSNTNSRRPSKPMSIESVRPSNHLIFCRPLLLLSSIYSSIRVFSNEPALCIRWPKCWKKSYDQPRQHFKKQRYYFANKGPSNQSYDFSSSHVWMWAHPLLSPSPPAPNPSQQQSLFQWVNSSHEVATVLEFQL